MAQNRRYSLNEYRGFTVGRPRRDIDLDAVAELRAVGRSWRDIAQALHVPRRTLTSAWALAQNPDPVQAA